MFAALEDSDTEVEIYSAWKMIRENRKMSAKESLGYFDEGCSELFDQRKQAQLLWLQNPNENKKLG
jgi:hypothetical protein